MKLTVIGGAGARVPLLLHGLIERQRELPLEEVVLYDPARDALDLMGGVCWELLRRDGEAFRLRIAASLEAAVDGASFVLTSIRAGGMAARAADERFLLDRGLLGQETVGAAGFAKALRTIPPMLEIVGATLRGAPRAWIINFTNPVGIVTQAIRTALPEARIIGICDTPLELFHGLARAAGMPFERLRFDYFGLNHLGWVKGVMDGGRDLLPQILADPERVRAVYERPIFSPELLAGLGVFPTDYLYFYYAPEAAVAHLRAAGQTRAEQILEMNRRLAAELSRGRGLAAYEKYLAGRNATYLQLETDMPRPQQQLYSASAGYDRIALAVLTALHNDTGDIIAVDVDNEGAIRGYDRTATVEVPCAIGRSGPRPLDVGAAPQSVAALLRRVKDYENLTVQAALEASLEKASEALAANPLIDSRSLAEDLVAEFVRMHPGFLGYLR